jgi:hypothetical protein
MSEKKLQQHMDTSSIEDLIKYIKKGSTPQSCNNIYTIAQAIQYMDDTYLREYTTEKLRSMKPDKPKTPVPYNEWIGCMFKPIEETWHEPTTHMERENWSHDRKMRISDNNGLSCATKECRESKGLGSCLPKSRMLKDSLSTEENNDLIMLRTAIMENQIDELKKIIDDADSVEGAYKNLKKYVLVDDSELADWESCIDDYNNGELCSYPCEIGKTPKICRPKSAKRISSKPVASYEQAYDQLANAISEKEKKGKEQKEKEQKKMENEQKERDEKYQREVNDVKYQREVNDVKSKLNKKKMEHLVAQGLDPLSGSIALTSDQLEAIKNEKDRKRVGSRGRAAAKKANAINYTSKGGRQTRKRKGRSSTKKHKKNKKHKKRASTKKHKKYKKKRKSTRKRS